MPTPVARDPATVLALSTFVKLRRSVNGLGARLNGPLGKDHGLTETQFGVLEALYHLGPMPQARLCEKLLVSGSNLTTVIDNLERGGLVRRDPNPEDRRAYLIRLSDAGKSLIARAFPEHAVRVRALLGVLTQVEQRELGRLCRKLGLGMAAVQE
ncbi:MAG TPA: MarR family transcriptional regulator [Gemmatimonadales bacterium]|nr:MarR family transcriptional regulator [Gemmatimonadales bacterium]